MSEAKARWLRENDNIILPKTLDTQVYDSVNGTSLKDRLRTVSDEQEVSMPKLDPTYFFSDLDYSEEEQLTGKRWVDGKPIYEIYISGDVPNSTNTTTIRDCKDLNIDSMVSFEFILKRDNGICIPLPWTDNNQWRTVVNMSNDKKLQVSTIVSLYGKIYGVIRYTKTTDTPSSPVKPYPSEVTHDYSEEEKIVGTWIDGKSIYEKTISCSFANATDSSTYVDVGASIDKMISAQGYAETSSYGFNFNSYSAGSSSIGGQVLFEKSNRTRLRLKTLNPDFKGASGYITVQYTKNEEV